MRLYTSPDPSPRSPAPSSRWLRIAIAAAAYWAAGRIALLLAIPPGYATAIWPAAGLALAGTLIYGSQIWPGILFGSFCVNVATSFDDSSTVAVFGSLLLAASIGAGAAGQAVFGARLVRRFVGFPNALTERAAVLRFLTLGGPVACLVSATVGVASLIAAGVMTWADLPFSWLTWWVGDTIGVLIVTPLVLVWAGEPGQVWRRRRIGVALPLCCALVMAMASFVLASAWEQQRIRTDFERRAEDLAEAIERSFDVCTEVVRSLASAFTLSPDMRRDDFARFVERPLARHPALLALSIDFLVPASERAAYEQRMRQESHPSFEITELDARGEMVRAAERDEYLVVTFVEPRAANARVIGYDVASEPVRLEAAERAGATGEPAATGPLTLVQDAPYGAGLLVFAPIYGDERTHELAACAVGVFRIDHVVDAALADLEREGIEIELDDRTTSPGDRPLHLSQIDRRAMSWTTEVDVAGRRWELGFAATREYTAAKRSWGAWVVIAGGLLFASLLGAFLLVESGRSLQVEELASDLAASNAELQREAEQREKAQVALERKAEELARSNADLEHFASIATHDLREPLRMVTSFLELLERRYRGRLDGDADEFIHFAVDGARRMDQMIQALLAYSRVGRDGRPFETVDASETLAAAMQNLKNAVDSSGAEVPAAPLPKVRGDRSQLIQLFQNLVENAIKYRGDEPPRIEVSSRSDDSFWIFAVKDNGIGMDPGQATKAFQLFQRLHSRDKYPGSGIGLSIAKKIVENHGGRIWVESIPGSGSTFYFSLPKS